MKTFMAWLENINDKHLIIMRGLPGSGKSTKAKKLGIGGVVYSTDDFFDVNGQYVFDPTKLKEYHEKNQHRTELAMRKGISPIVIDNTNVFADHIKPYVKLGDMYGYKIKLELPDTEWAWDAEQLANKNSHGVPKHAIDRMLNNFQHDVSIENLRYQK